MQGEGRGHVPLARVPGEHWALLRGQHQGERSTHVCVCVVKLFLRMRNAALSAHGPYSSFCAWVVQPLRMRSADLSAHAQCNPFCACVGCRPFCACVVRKVHLWACLLWLLQLFMRILVVMVSFLRACVVQFYHYMCFSAFFCWFSFGPKRELGKEFRQEIKSNKLVIWKN